MQRGGQAGEVAPAQAVITLPVRYGLSHSKPPR